MDKETPNTAKELRQLYNVTSDTWTKWLKPLRHVIPKNTKVYTPKQVQAIIEHLGEPNN